MLVKNNLGFPNPNKFLSGYSKGVLFLIFIQILWICALERLNIKINIYLLNIKIFLYILIFYWSCLVFVLTICICLGYLAAEFFLHPQHELVILLINTIQKVNIIWLFIFKMYNPLLNLFNAALKKQYKFRKQHY